MQIFNNWLTVDYNSANPKNNVINQILNYQIGGAVIQNFIGANQAKNLIDGLNYLKKNNNNEVNGAQNQYFPEPFSVLANHQFNEDILKTTLPNGNQLLSKALNFFDESSIEAYKRHLFSGFRMLANNYFFEPAKLSGEVIKNEPAFFTTLREMPPGAGGINKHNEKDLQLYYTRFFELLNIPSPHFQLSYFILLQKPEKGGELCVHNQYFLKNHQHEPDTEVFYVPINVGDLVIFNGGDCYHSVSNIAGNRSRITIGGFLSLKDNTFFSWS